jgi:hypothetical protein
MELMVRLGRVLQQLHDERRAVRSTLQRAAKTKICTTVGWTEMLGVEPLHLRLGIWSILVSP